MAALLCINIATFEAFSRPRIDELPHVELDGLRMSVDLLMNASSIEIVSPDEFEQFVRKVGSSRRKRRSSPANVEYAIRARVFLQNVSKDPMLVLLLDSFSGEFSDDCRNLEYRLLLKNRLADADVKLRLEDYRPILLFPGEIAQLPDKWKVLTNDVDLNFVSVTYVIPPEIEAYGDHIWTGTMSVDVELVKPTSK